jgi:transcription elongation factor SPT5
MLPADPRSAEEDGKCIALSVSFCVDLLRPLAVDEQWIFDPVLANYLHRIKIVIKGTKTAQYINGDYEGKTGRMVAAQKAPEGLDQTARVQFFDTGEERSFAVRYITPQEPKFSSEEVLVLDGKLKGMVLLVREKPDIDEMIAVSSRQHPVDFDYVPKKNMVALTEEGPQ